MNYVIIGNSAAAVGAVEGIRQVDKTNPITIIADEPYHTYSRPLISYYLAGKVSKEKMAFRRANFYQQNNVTTRLGEKVTGIDTSKQQVSLANGETVSYDRLLIATGGTPVVPPIGGVDKENVFTFIKMDDVLAVQKVAALGLKTVIVGAGLIGLKAAEALVRLGVQVTVVELANRVLPAILDEQAAEIVQARLEREGVSFMLNSSVETITGDQTATGVTVGEKYYPADLVIIAVGVKPNTEIVKETAVKVNRGIVIDEQCETNVPGVFAAGDVAEGYDTVLKEMRVLPIWPNAYRQGETAGLNMAGQNTAYKGGFAMNSIGFFGLPMITAGVIKSDEGCEELIKADPIQEIYKKIIIKDNKVVGFIYLNQVDRAGIVTGLISDEIDVSNFKSALLRDDFGYIDFPGTLRKTRLLRGVGIS